MEDTPPSPPPPALPDATDSPHHAPVDAEASLRFSSLSPPSASPISAAPLPPLEFSISPDRVPARLFDPGFSPTTSNVDAESGAAGGAEVGVSASLFPPASPPSLESSDTQKPFSADPEGVSASADVSNTNAAVYNSVPDVVSEDPFFRCMPMGYPVSPEHSDEVNSSVSPIAAEEAAVSFPQRFDTADNPSAEIAAVEATASSDIYASVLPPSPSSPENFDESDSPVSPIDAVEAPSPNVHAAVPSPVRSDEAVPPIAADGAAVSSQSPSSPEHSDSSVPPIPSFVAAEPTVSSPELSIEADSPVTAEEAAVSPLSPSSPDHSEQESSPSDYPIETNCSLSSYAGSSSPSSPSNGPYPSEVPAGSGALAASTSSAETAPLSAPDASNALKSTSPVPFAAPDSPLNASSAVSSAASASQASFASLYRDHGRYEVIEFETQPFFLRGFDHIAQFSDCRPFYLAESSTDSSRSVLKYFPLPAHRSARFTRELLKSIDVLLRVHSPFLERLQHVFELPQHLVFQFVSLSPQTLSSKLAAHASRCAPIPESEVRRILLSLLRGLHYLHRHQSFHYYLQPSSVILQDSLEVQLSDFLLPSLFEYPGELSNSASLLAYRAPECFEQPSGAHPFQDVWQSQMADVWSFGVMAIELCLLRVPLLLSSGGPSSFSQPQGSVTVEPQGYSDGLRRLIGRCLSRDPQARPRVSDLLRDAYFSSEEEGAEATA